MKLKKNIHKFQEIIFNYVIIITYILYIIILFGLSSSAPEYLNDLQKYTKIYVSLFLILRFNPFRQIEFTKLDSRIAFSAGLFLFTTSALQDSLVIFIRNINSKIKDTIKYYKNNITNENENKINENKNINNKNSSNYL